MSAPFTQNAEMELLTSLLEAVRAMPDIKQAFGQKARVFDDESQSPYYPFIQLDAMETVPFDCSVSLGQEHRLNFSVYSRDGGRAECLRLIGLFRAALEALEPTLTSQRIVLKMVTFADVFRTKDSRKFRGALRLRVITEEA